MKRFISILVFVLLLIAAPATMQAKTKAVDKTTSANDSAASNDNRIFYMVEVEQKPSYPGGDEQLMRDLCDKLIIPPIAADLCYEGRCIIQFVVTKTGEVGECKVVRSLFDVYDQAVINAIKSLPQKFIPGRKNGQPVDVLYILPVSYRMQKDDPTTPQEK